MVIAIQKRAELIDTSLDMWKEGIIMAIIPVVVVVVVVPQIFV
jgi:hypothetical protein